MEKTQREYYLNEIKAIQKELGEIEDGKDETSNLTKLYSNQKCQKMLRKNVCLN